MIGYQTLEDIEREDITIESIIKILKTNFPKSNTSRVEDAYTLASLSHEGQKRKTGEAYIHHPLYVAYFTALIKLDESSVIAALLHDTVEDTPLTLDEIKEKFGEDTAFLVDGLTKIKKVTKKVKHSQDDFETLRKLLIASTKDIRVILIKLADRMHNIMTVQALALDRQRENALETLKFYAPLADFVGINFFRKKLEDYSFKIIEPEIYEQIETYLRTNALKEGGKSINRETFITKHVAYFSKILKDYHIKGEVFGRHKGVYSIYRKLLKKHGEFLVEDIKEVNDLIGITILVNSISECYRVLGIMHSQHEHLAYLFDDYIAKPKSNGYRSIHTCLVSKEGVKTALQIKTYKMQEYNEYGPASHIYYKEKEKNVSILGSKIGFLKSLVRWRDEIKNIEYYKVDVFKDKVFVFTPNGDVKELPKGATAIDFAYLIHTNIGNACRGVKVNGVIKPLSYEVQTGDVIEVLLDKKRVKPSMDWLNFAKTPYARANIRRAFREEEAIEEQAEDEKENEESNRLQEKLEFIPFEDEERKVISEKISEANLVKIKGIENIDCSIAKCCSPIPGDDIIGHVTKTRGIRIHRKNCKELEILDYKVLLEAEWANMKKEFLTGLYIQTTSQDNTGMIKEISKLLSDMKIGIEKLDSWNNNGFNGRIAVNVTSKGQLETLIRKLKKIQKVSHVERVNIT